MYHFSTLIQDWYRQNRRNLPWRNSINPYFIWVSEVILQQTRVEQGVVYFNKVIRRFPDVNSLASSDEQEVLRLWQGLGYYSRARNLHFAAQQIVDEYNGVFPNRFEDIIKLKGIGDYTASAISSIAFQLPHAVVDGNVFRVLSRFYNDSTPIDSTEGFKIFKAYASELLDKDNPGQHNQAVMELGALICTPKNPKCEICPLKMHCLAYTIGSPLDLPIKAKKTKVSHRYFNYLVHHSDVLQLVKRNEKDIWKNLFQFPLVESEKSMSKKELQEVLQNLFEGCIVRKKIDKIKHILSHQHIVASFWEINQPILSGEILNIDLKELNDYPIPRLIEKFLEKNGEIFYL